MTVENKGVDFGPLETLIGKWVGETGLDIAPNQDCDPCDCAYVDELTFEPVGDVTNAREQTLISIRYHHVVRRRDNGEVFHDQIGHWLYEPATGLVMHSISLPRGVCLLAGGTVTKENGQTIFEVEATRESDTFGIIQSPFMLEKARTDSFHMKLSVSGDSMKYRQSTMLHIYGKDFDHIDTSELKQVSD